MRGSCVALDRAWRAAVLAAAFVSFVAWAPNGRCAAEPPLVLEATIPLANVEGRIDHMAIDVDRNRLIVAELGNGTVDVIDLAAGKLAHRLDGLKAPQGVAYAKASDLIAVASADDGTVRLFHAADFSPAGVIALGEDADNVRVDSRSGRIVVGYGGGGLAVIDPATAAAIATIPLAAHPEGFQLHPKDGRIFINVPNARQIAVVDRTAGSQVATWKPSDWGANFPMAIDPAGTVVASVFRSPAHLVLFASETGAVTADVAVCADADDVFFDAKRHRLYVSCGAGVVDIFEQAPTLGRIARFPTASGARTALFVPELDRLFVAARAGSPGSTASILVLRPQP